MESKTKTPIEIPSIHEMVKDCFGSSFKIASINELTAGWFNTVYSIEFLNDHPGTVLRVAPPPNMRLLSYERDLMRSEVKAYRIVRENTSVPVPELFEYNFKQNIIENHYMFIEKYLGVPMDSIQDQNEDEKKSVYEELNKIAAQIHSVKGHRFGYLGTDSRLTGDTWKQAFLGMVFTLLDDGQELGVELPLPYYEIMRLFKGKAAVLDQITEPRLVHWDLWPGNIFIKMEDGRYRIEGIIDWERTFWGDPEAEASFATFKGFGGNSSNDPPALTRRCMYGIHLYLVMVIEARIRFESAPHVAWAYENLHKELSRLKEL